MRIWAKANKALLLCSLAVVIAFAMRLFVASGQIIAPDGLLYIKIAKSVSSGDLQSISGYGFFNLYSFLIALFQKVFHDWELSGKMVSVVLGSLTAIPLFLLVKGFVSTRVAFVATLFYAVHPRFVEYSADVLREPTCWFFSILGLWLAREGITRGRYALFALSSLSLGLAMVTRLEGAIFFLVVILWILWAFYDDRALRVKALVYLCIFLLSLPLLMSPFLLIVKSRIHRWELGHPIEKISQLVMANEPTGEAGADISKTASARFKGFLEISERHRYATFTMEVLYKFVKSFHIVLFALFVIGLYKRASTPYSKGDIAGALWFCAAFCGLFLYVMKVHYLSTRHGLLMVMPTLAWAGVGFFEVCERVRGWLVKHDLTKCGSHSMAILLFLVVAVLVPQSAFSGRSDKIELKKAGLVLKHMGYSGSTFMVQPGLNRVSFYAGSETIYLPTDVDTESLRKLIGQSMAARLIIVDEMSIDSYAPGFRTVVAAGTLKRLAIPELKQYKEYAFAVYEVR